MDETLGAAFNLGLASANEIAEVCASKEEIIQELRRFLVERRKETYERLEEAS